MKRNEKKGDWLIWTCQDKIRVRCSRCKWEVPDGNAIPDVCPCCGSKNIPSVLDIIKEKIAAL